MKKITIVGSINMDYTLYVKYFPLPGETIIGKDRFVQPGGKGENQAVAVAKSNLVETHFMSAIGKDNDGESIAQMLNELGIRSHLKESSLPTGNATIVVDDSSENEITIIAGANSDIKKEDIDVELVKNSDCVILQNEIPLEVNNYVIDLANKNKVLVIYNPAPFKQIDKNILSKVDYLIVNEVELEQYSNKNDLDSGVNALLNKGVKNVLVTLGKNGSCLVNLKEAIQVPAFVVKAVDTVAAGDTYVGYFASALVNGYTPKQAMEIASKASSITVQRKGSVVSIPFGNEVLN